MKKLTPRIEKAIDIFLDALNDGTLASGHPCGCAVGNLVSFGIEGNITSYTDVDNYSGVLFKCTENNTAWHYGSSVMSRNNEYPELTSDAKSNIDATDFSAFEIFEIESAFECGCKIGHGAYSSVSKQAIRQDQINGLAAVVKVMMTFDDVQEDIQEVFINKAELIELN